MSNKATMDGEKVGAAPVASYEDVRALERAPLADRNIPPTPYEMLRAGAAIAPDAPALTFFADARRRNSRGL